MDSDASVGSEKEPESFVNLNRGLTLNLRQKTLSFTPKKASAEPFAATL